MRQVGRCETVTEGLDKQAVRRRRRERERQRQRDRETQRERETDRQSRRTKGGRNKFEQSQTKLVCIAKRYEQQIKGTTSKKRPPG